MKVIIRTDASVTIGSGHVMRCLTIAEMLRANGCTVLFMMERLPGDMIETVRRRGFPVIQEFQRVDVCVIDHYGIDEQWERAIRPLVKKIVVIDDLANRRHDCDLLLDQNVVPSFENRYQGLVPEHCIQLLGPKYLIMREEFIRERQKMSARDGDVQRLLVFMGGSDPTNETVNVLTALRESDVQFKHVDVVVGASNEMRSVIEEICGSEGYQFHCQITYMASLMGQADFSIGAGGSTTWERCYVGLPAASTIVAENQLVATETAAELGAVWNLGWYEEVTVTSYKELIQSLPFKADALQQMSQRGLQLTETELPNPWLKNIMELMQE